MMKFYDEDHCLVNVANSILKHFSLETKHNSLKSLDEVLEKTNKRVCLIMLDGFGKFIQEEYRYSCKYILDHKFDTITSVFPPTTVAATTSLTTGLFPMETGWLGWTEQFVEYERSITMFSSTFAQEPIEVSPKKTIEMCPTINIIDILNEHGIKAKQIHSFEYKNPSVDNFFIQAEKEVKKYNFLYAYCTEPDSSLHEFGVGSKDLIPLIERLNKGVKNIVEHNKDVLFILLADHGHKNANYFNIREHDDFYSCLRITHFALEPRAAAFFVKEDKKEEFKKLANKYYLEHFYIFTKEEVIENKIFGIGKENKRFRDLIGDYLLASKDSSAFVQSENDVKLVSHHAGTTDEEKFINIALFNND